MDLRLELEELSSHLKDLLAIIGENIEVEFGQMGSDGTYGTFELTPKHLANCKSQADILKTVAKLANSFK